LLDGQAADIRQGLSQHGALLADASLVARVSQRLRPDLDVQAGPVLEVGPQELSPELVAEQAQRLRASEV
jgi:hypothetical protein